MENRGGAGGLIGSLAVAKAAPDGYTFVISGIASHIIAPATNAKAGFDPVASFSHIAYIGGPPVVFVVHPSLRVKTLNEFLEAVRKEKDGLSYVSPGTGTQDLASTLARHRIQYRALIGATASRGVPPVSF